MAEVNQRTWRVPGQRTKRRAWGFTVQADGKQKRVYPSVDISNPAIDGQGKTGQTKARSSGVSCSAFAGREQAAIAVVTGPRRHALRATASASSWGHT